MDSFEREIKNRRILEILQVRSSYDTQEDIQKAKDDIMALGIVEKAAIEGKISEDVVNKIKKLR